MAKIDVSSIKGYEEMSVEEKLKALESYEYDDGATTIKTLKETISKANSEAADWKRQHHELLSKDEKEKLEREEEFNSMKSKLATLEKEKTVADYTAKFTSMGYDEELAVSTANAYADGDLTTVFANQKKFNEQYEQKIKANLLKNTPSPKVGAVSDKTLTKEEFGKLSYNEMLEFKREHPEEFKKYSE